MKDSGIAWIGEIPEEWLVAPVSCMTNSRSGGTPDRNNMNYWDNGTIPWMSSGEVNKINVYETDEKITEAATRGSSAKVIKKNAVMVALNGQGKTKGMSAVLRIDSACNQSLCAFSCHEEKLYYEYLFWCFQSMYTYLRQMSGDDVRDGLAASYVRKRKIPVPPLSEQHAIAAYLDRKCGQIDDIIADLQRQIECLQSYKKSLISEAVTKGLNPDVPMKDSGIEWIGQIPEHWEMLPFRVCVQSVTSGLSAVTNDDTEESGKYVLRTSAVSSGVFIVTEVKAVTSYAENRLVCPVEADTVIMSRMNTSAMVGASAYIERNYEGYFLPDKLWKVKFNDRLLAKYAWYLMNSEPVRRWFGCVATGSSASMQNIEMSDFLHTYVPIPGVTEQKQLATYLDRKCAEIDTILDDKRRQVENMKNHRKSVIYEYVTGKKRVKEV